MAVKKVWHEELQSWVFEDPDDVNIPDDINPEDYGVEVVPKVYPVPKSTLPLRILEGRPRHAKSNKTK